MKRTIRLTESDLHMLVEDVIKAQMASGKSFDLGRISQSANIHNKSVDDFNRDFGFYEDDKGGRFKLCYEGGLCYFNTTDANRRPAWRAKLDNKEEGLRIANSLRANFRRRMLKGIETYYQYIEGMKTNVQAGRKAYEDE